MQHTDRQISSETPSLLDNAVEGLLYAVIFLSPWAFGCTDAVGEFYLTFGISLILLLGCARWMTGSPPAWRGRRTGASLVLGTCVLAASAATHLLPVPDGVREWIAPGAAQWLAPTEWLGAQNDPSIWNAGRGLTVYSGGSFLMLVRLGLAAGLCLVIGTLPNPRRVLFRTSVLTTVLGTALALFGIAQHYGAHNQLLYWSIPIEGGLGFGPFANRNHYPFFLNLTLGLAIGLLADRLQRFGSAWPRMIFNDAAFAWLIAAIGIMLSSLVICVSRGGVLSAFLAICTVGALRFRIAEAGRSILLTALVGVPLVTLLIWVGFDVQESRLSMLTESDRYSTDGRWYLWESALMSVPQFPWFGSGGETYQFWETIHQVGDVAWKQNDMYSLRADNEFLDILCEYGLVGLLGLSLVAAAVCLQSFRSSHQSGLVAGGAIGLLAVLMHSFVDFGLRVPATGVLALVVAMLLCSQTPRTPGDRTSRQMPTPKPKSRSTGQSDYKRFATPDSPHRAFANIQWTLLALVITTVTFSSIRIRRRYFEAENARREAIKHIENLAYDEALSKLQQAVVATPEDALMRMEVARVAEYVQDHSQSQRQKNAATKMIVDHSQVLMQQCPLDWKAYTWTAQHDPTLTPLNQLELVRRARTLHAGQPDLAYLAGKLELSQGSIETALPHWQESLSVSRKHLPQICQMMQGRLSTEQWTNELLPEDPVVTFATATELPSPLRESILERTLTLLANPDRLSRKPSPGQWDALRGETLAELKQYDRGIAMMRRGINQQPDNIDWRLKLATWCVREQRLEEAVREIRIALTLDPENRDAARLQKMVSQEKARLQNPPVPASP